MRSRLRWSTAFAKEQLGLLLNRRYLHPNGQLPACEWNFSDVNPPVHAWATLFVYEIEEATTGKADRAFLEDAFQKLMRNFSWWLNRKDADNRNIFQGGFLGLDNIGVFDRGAPLPGGGWIDQADGTAWMALYCQNMMQIALELAPENDEPPDVELADWYRRLLAAVDSHQVRADAWRLLEASGWPDNQSRRNMVAWSWAGDRGGDRHVVVVNFSEQPAQARIPLDWPGLPGRCWRFTDILSQDAFERDAAELASPGLFVGLGPWQFHLLAVR